MFTPVWMCALYRTAYCRGWCTKHTDVKSQRVAVVCPADTLSAAQIHQRKNKKKPKNTKRNKQTNKQAKTAEEKRQAKKLFVLLIQVFGQNKQMPRQKVGERGGEKGKDVKFPPSYDSVQTFVSEHIDREVSLFNI